MLAPEIFPLSISSRRNKSDAGKVAVGNVLMHSASIKSFWSVNLARFTRSVAVRVIPLASKSFTNRRLNF